MSTFLHLFFMYLMAIFYIIAGISHFLTPKFYLAIMPRYMPYHLELVYLSGAWLTIALLIAVYPANIQMVQDYWSNNHPQKYAILVRLPLQFVFIWWAYQYTKPIQHSKLH
ncbi:unnamed protein product [Rotaria sordida]|uniref:Uncharacterized protein n=1 Tax=Rotaria sordida TaxID=392033 RepID=A0A814M7S9_9BILA|nr:unnamed protein product [Rotaria sordida]CAF1075180.1 unnamed protein product [Rotaria sordida]CAF1079881.1 unnamed protein product [Rotaria sordida]